MRLNQHPVITSHNLLPTITRAQVGGLGQPHLKSKPALTDSSQSLEIQTCPEPDRAAAKPSPKRSWSSRFQFKATPLLLLNLAGTRFGHGRRS